MTDILLPISIGLGIVSFIFAYFSVRLKALAFQYLFMFMTMAGMIMLLGLNVSESTGTVQTGYMVIIFCMITVSAYILIKMLQAVLMSFTSKKFELERLE